MQKSPENDQFDPILELPLELCAHRPLDLYPTPLSERLTLLWFFIWGGGLKIFKQ